MKTTLILLLVIIVFCNTNFSQTPQAFKYQAAVRNADGIIIADKNVNFKITLLKDSITGTSVYSELQSVKTNSLGIVNLEIGSGQFHTGDFASIQWGKNKYFVKIELDADGNGYKEMGTSQLLSVPYALFAQKSGNDFSGNYNDLSNRPTLSTVATSGNFNDLTNKPNTIEGYGINNLPKIISGNNKENGTGYTVSGNTVTFTNPFSSTPNATVSINGSMAYSTPYIITITSISSTSMTVGIYTWVNNGSSPTAQGSLNLNYSFIVVGK